MVTVDPIGDMLEATRRFTEVATSDPLSAVLIALGGLFTFAAVAVFGGLSAGAAVGVLTRLLEEPDRPE
jgi:hypothetical protein